MALSSVRGLDHFSVHVQRNPNRRERSSASTAQQEFELSQRRWVYADYALQAFSMT